MLNENDRKIIVCRRGDNSGPGPWRLLGRVTHCESCNAEIHCYPVTLERQKQGFHLVCRECFRSMVEFCNKKGIPIQFAGRVSYNKFPGDRADA